MMLIPLQTERKFWLVGLGGFWFRFGSGRAKLLKNICAVGFLTSTRKRATE